MHISHPYLARPARRTVAATLALILAVTFLPATSVNAAVDAELVGNGDFSGGTTGWTSNRPSNQPLTVERVGQDGSNAGVITTATTETAVLNDAVDTVTSAVKGTSYTLTAWVRSDRAGAVTQVKAREGSGSESYSHAIRVKLAGTGWEKVTLSFSSKFASSTLDLNVLFWGLTKGQKVFVDSVSMIAPQAVPPTQPPIATPPNPAPGPGAQPGACTRPAPTGVAFGSSISTSGQTHAQAVAGVDSLFGRVPVIRVFDPGMVMPWSAPRTGMIAGRDLVMSFRPMPQDVLAGKYDAAFREWFQKAPADVKIYWSYIHEPEPLIDQGKFTADQYRRAWQRIEGIADTACRSNMYPTLILTGWTTSPASKRDWRTYYPGSDVIDVMGFDPYNGAANPGREGIYASPASIYDSVRRVANEAGKPYGIAETGSLLVPGDSGAGRAAWLRSMADYHRKNGAVFVTYFQSTNGGEYRLLDQWSRAAWREATSSSR